jgi:hypothetical protein
MNLNESPHYIHVVNGHWWLTMLMIKKKSRISMVTDAAIELLSMTINESLTVKDAYYHLIPYLQ